MAKFEMNGLPGWEADIEKLLAMPDSLLEQMLIAEAEEIEKSQRNTGKQMGVHDTGFTLASIKVGKLKKSGFGKQIEIYPDGRRPDGKRAAEVAFINNFGRKGQPARPFIDVGNAKGIGSAIQRAEKIYSAWLDQNIGD